MTEVDVIESNLPESEESGNDGRTDESGSTERMGSASQLTNSSDVGSERRPSVRRQSGVPGAYPSDESDIAGAGAATEEKAVRRGSKTSGLNTGEGDQIEAAQKETTRPDRRPSDDSTSDTQSHDARMQSLNEATRKYEEELKWLEDSPTKRASKQPKNDDPYSYRHYQSLHPTTNKLLGKKWEIKDRKIHAQKIAKAKSMIDTRPPKKFSHLQTRMKKAQMAEDRQAQIQRENQILVDKMIAIMKMEKKAYAQRPSPLQYAHSLNAPKRNRDLVQLEKDNLAMLNRLEHRASFYDHGAQLADRHQNLCYLRNIASYPQRFIQEEKRYEQLEKTHESAHDPNHNLDRKQQLEADWKNAIRTSVSGRSSVASNPKRNSNVRFQSEVSDKKEADGPRFSKTKNRSQTPKLGVADVDSRLLASENSLGGPRPLPSISSNGNMEGLEREVSPIAMLAREGSGRRQVAVE